MLDSGEFRGPEGVQIKSCKMFIIYELDIDVKSI